MKALLSAGLAFISFCALAQPYTFTSLSEMGIKGKVKTITHEKFVATTNEELKEVVISRAPGLSNFSIQFFNRNGQLEKRESYSADQFTGEKILNHLDTFEYENGRLVYRLNGDVHGQRMNPGYKGVEYRYEYKTENEMLVKCESEYCGDHSRYLLSKNEHTIERLSSKMEVHTTEKIYFDDRGKEKSFIRFSSEGKPIDNIQYIYSDDNEQNPSSSLRTVYSTNTTTTCHYQYNEHNDLVSETCHENEGGNQKTRSYQYLYDQQGNWVEKKFFGSSGQTGDIHRRTITYWDE
jgi:hypothetical protein